jgi:hypothetical protein
VGLSDVLPSVHAMTHNEAIAWCEASGADVMWDQRYADMRLVTVYVRRDGQAVKTEAFDEGGMLDALLLAVEKQIALEPTTVSGG